MGEWIELEWYEQEIAAFCGILRRVESFRAGRHRAEWNNKKETNEVQSAAAEMALAKFLDRYWGAGVNTFKKVGDVSTFIEVRHTRRTQGRLLVRDDDADDRPFYLVRGELPKFEIVGWKYGKDAKQKQWYENPDNNGWCYFVPESALRQLDDLPQ